MMEFYRDGDLLFYKINNQIWGALYYSGNNTFTGGNTEAKFELLLQGKAKVQYRFSRRKEIKLEGTKVLLYKEPGQ